MGVLAPEEPQGVLGPATVNPLLAAQVARWRQYPKAADPTPEQFQDLESWKRVFERNFKENWPQPGDTQREQIDKLMAQMSVGGGAAGIIKPELARTLTTTRAKPSIRLEEAVRNTPGAAFTDDGLLMQVRRMQKPEQEGELSVRGGVFYEPQYRRNQYKPSNNKWYGGSEEFKGDTVLHNPLVAFGATGGNVMERAYKKLLGDEALRDLHGKVAGANLRPDYYRPPLSSGQMIEKIGDFLATHAPEMTGMESAILRNSAPETNQLRYALQEAAIGSAARKRGYDSILGYSHGYGKPSRLSELYDLRERTYPMRLGGEIQAPEIWERFLAPPPDYLKTFK